MIELSIAASLLLSAEKAHFVKKLKSIFIECVWYFIFFFKKKKTLRYYILSLSGVSLRKLYGFFLTN